MTIVDILDDDAEADKKCVKEQWLPIDSPLLYTCHNDDVCASEMFHVLPVGGTGDLVVKRVKPQTDSTNSTDHFNRLFFDIINTLDILLEL